MIREYNGLKILEVIWSSGPMLVFGLVLVENSHGVRKVYLGPGVGVNEDDDIRSICHASGKLHPSSAADLFRHFGGEIDPEEDWGSALLEIENLEGGSFRQAVETVTNRVTEIRKDRKKAIGDRPGPDKHPAAKESG